MTWNRIAARWRSPWKPATGEKLQMQRTAASAMSLMKWDSLRDKENFKMMCTYCHQAGTVGFRTPEQPVDWETMVRRMDGFGGLYRHTQKTIVKRAAGHLHAGCRVSLAEVHPAPTSNRIRREGEDQRMGHRQYP